MFKDPVLQDIFNDMCRVSGNHPDHTHHAGLPYGSYHHPKFTYMSNHITRDTLVRFKEFDIPDRLDNIVFFDMGCNLGNMTIELARRGAKVKSFDCVTDRLDVLRRLVNYLDYQDQIEVHCVDFQKCDPQEFVKKYGKADNVICLAVDGYITQYVKFYEFLSLITNEHCYFESNLNKDILPILQKTFKNVQHLGHSQTSNALRQIYKLDNIITLRRTGGQFSKHHYLNNEGSYIKQYEMDYLNHFRLISKLNHPYIIPMRVQANKIIMPHIKNGYPLGQYNSNGLVLYRLSIEEKKIVKKQLIEVVKYLYDVKIAHRDLTVANILWLPDEKKILVIDWEFIQDDNNSMEHRYDLSTYNDYNSSQIFHKNSVFTAYNQVSTLYSYLDNNLSMADFVQ